MKTTWPLRAAEGTEQHREIQVFCGPPFSLCGSQWSCILSLVTFSSFPRCCLHHGNLFPGFLIIENKNNDLIKQLRNEKT